MKIQYYNKLLFSVLQVFISLSLFSQQTTTIVKGNIFTSDGQPVEMVTVELRQSGKRTLSDRNGAFILPRLSSDDTLILTKTGFLDYKKMVHANKNEVTDLGNIQLLYAITYLQNVEITGRINQSYKSDYSFAGTKSQAAVKDIPQTMSTVTKELIKDKMNLRLTEALDNVAGINHYSGYDEYTIRGFRAENPHLINGLRTYNTTLTSPMLVNIERVEIIKGPTSVLYGNADPGGTINLVTKKPLQQEKYQADIFAGTWNNFMAQADLTGAINKSKTLLYRFNAGYENTKSFREIYYAKSFQAAPSLSFIPNQKLQLNIDLSVSHTNTIADRGVPGLRDNYDLSVNKNNLIISQPGDYLKETNIASLLSFSYKFNRNITFNSAWLNYITKQSLSEQGLKDYITDDSVSLYYLNRQFNTNTNSLTNYFTFQFNTGKLSHQLLAGYDFVKSSVDISKWNGEIKNLFGENSGIAGTFSLLKPMYFKRPVATYQHQEKDDGDDDADEYYSNGIYLQEQLSYNKWKLLASLREEYYTGTGDENIKQQVLLPRIGIVFNAYSNINLYATYNKGFDPFEVISSTYVFTAPLKPIYSEMFESGIKADLFKSRLSATFALYQVTLKNVAVNANDPGNPDLYTQRGEERARGIETEINGNVLKNLDISASYAYNIAKITKSGKAEEIGQTKENAAQHTSSSRIKYSFAKGRLKNLSIIIGHSQAGKRNTFEKKLILPGYVILNAGIQYSYKQVTIAVNANNIFDKKYWIAAYNNINKWPGTPGNLMIRLGYNF